MYLNLKRVLASVLTVLLLISCEKNDELESDFPNPGMLKIYVKAQNWEQDSIIGAYLKVDGIELDGSRGNTEMPIAENMEANNLMTIRDRDNLIVVQEMPAGVYLDFQVSFDFLQENEKVTICHLPPGNEENELTLNIGACAIPAHTRAHNDYLGPCTEEEDNRNRGYSYLQFSDGRKFVLQGSGDPYTNTTEFEIKEGDTTEVILTIDLENSISLKQDPEELEEDCLGYVFTPSAEIEVLEKKGEILGTYTERMLAGRDYLVFLYEEGSYSSREADRRNPFPNKLKETSLDSEGGFVFPDLDTGAYTVVLAEFSRNRLIGVIDQKDVEVQPTHVTLVNFNKQ